MMVKEKKAIQGQLLGRSVAFAGLTIFAFGLSYYLINYMLYWGSFLVKLAAFAVFGNADSDSGSFLTILSLYPIVALMLALIVVFFTWRIGKRIWGQWQRQAAIAEENERVQRLVEDNSSNDYDFDVDENLSQASRQS